MRKVLCTSIVLLLILGGITAAFAAEALKDAGAAAPDTPVAASTTPAIEATTTTAAAGAATTAAAVNTMTLAAADTATASSASDTATPEAVIAVPSAMDFTGTPIKLSLEDAYKKMLADSLGAKMAELNKQGADGVARGYGETVQNIDKAIDSEKQYNVVNWMLDTSNKKMLEANKKYAAEQGPRNYQAEINSLKRNTFENYYRLKELENQVAIAKDNLALKEKLLANTQLKYKLGTVSKNDVLKAETAVYEAKNALLAVENGLKAMKMGFNIFMGYDLLQNVVLTDTIKEIPLSTKSLDASIKDALANRNEIFEASYHLEIATMALDNVKAYPRSSSTYIKAKMAFLTAETGAKNAPLQVESDVRTKYMDMYTKYSAVQTGKKSVENAKETVRLAQLQYDAGMATISDVEGAQLAYYNEQLNYSRALLEYNLAVYDYELASTVGIKTNAIQ